MPIKPILNLRMNEIDCNAFCCEADLVRIERTPMTKLKIAFIGAGSRSFASRTLGDVLLSDALNEFDLELVLMDVIAEHITGTETFCSGAAEQLGRRVTVTPTTDLHQAVDGASFVVTALEVNRYLYWAQDFHIPRMYGSEQVYGENGGPGGIFHALRNMGPMLNIATAMAERCPDAWLINSSNPESKLCEALDRLTKIKTVGLCHGVFIGPRTDRRLLEMPEEDLQTTACGFNHFTWFQEIPRPAHRGRPLPTATRTRTTGRLAGRMGRHCAGPHHVSHLWPLAVARYESLWRICALGD